MALLLFTWGPAIYRATYYLSNPNPAKMLLAHSRAMNPFWSGSPPVAIDKEIPATYILLAKETA
jgi:hypothetical protein